MNLFKPILTLIGVGVLALSLFGCAVPIQSLPAGSGTASTTANTAALTQALNLPAGIKKNDLLLLTWRGGSTGASTTISVPGFSYLTTNAAHSTHVLYKIADGTEGSTVTATFGASSNGFSAAAKFSNVSLTRTPEITAFSSGTSSQPDGGPSLTPSWGAANTIWVSVCGISATAVSVTAYPTGFPDNHVSGQGTQSAGAAMASGVINTATEDPPAWTYSGAPGTWQCYTVAISPP